MIEVVQGFGPIVLGLPHTGTDLPGDIPALMNERGRAVADTDWYIHQLYAGLLDGVTTVRTPVHRYVVDVNRSPDNESLYPGQNTTGLCPLTDFDGQPIYRVGQEPDTDEIRRRTALFHLPYHQALQSELDRVKALHGSVILYDCHSIRSQIPFLFEGTLPDFNIGSNQSTTCAPEIELAVFDICRSQPGCSAVLNGRFKGGWTTRHYGRPAAGVHAIQMELAQSMYMEETPPRTFDPMRANRTREVLSQILNALQQLAATGVLQ